MTGTKFKVIAAALVALFLTSCDGDGTGGLPEDFDRTGEPLVITTVWYDTQREVDEAYVREFGRARNENSINRNGFAVWANPSREPKWCKIHSIKPKRVDDDAMTTLGHELTHCLIGTFHPEP